MLKDVSAQDGKEITMPEADRSFTPESEIDSTRSMEEAFATLFYEQCAGTTAGHMAPIPNNPVLFSMVKAKMNNHSHTHAASKNEFAELLREIARTLEY